MLNSWRYSPFKKQNLTKISLGEILPQSAPPGLSSRKMVNFNLGLNQILSKVFFSKNMQLKLTKHCWALTPRNSYVMISQNVTLNNS